METRHRFLAGVVSLTAVTAVIVPVHSSEMGIEWRMPNEYREVQRTTVVTQRELLHRMIDSIPDDLLRRSVSVGQRDFAQQTHHAAASVADALARLLRIPPPTWEDTSTALVTKDGLRNVVNVAFGFIDSVLTAQSLEDRNSTVTFAGRRVYAWQLFDEINEHTMWTAGQMVGNFRDANMPPPAFRFF